MNGTVRVDICAPSRMGALAPKSTDAPRSVTDSQSSRHHVEAVHATGALFVVDLKRIAVPGHALSGAQVDHFLVDVELAPVSACMRARVGFEFSADIGLAGSLVDPDVVSPGPDDRHVGTCYRRHAAVGAAVELELELVREGRPMEFVLILHGHLVGAFLGVVARELAAGHPEAG